MQTIPLHRVQLAIGIIADSFRLQPICYWGTSLQHMRYALSVKP